MNLTESLLHALKDHGARQIFGIPGDFALPFFRIIEQTQILPLYTLSHEPAVGFAADASARISMASALALASGMQVVMPPDSVSNRSSLIPGGRIFRNLSICPSARANVMAPERGVLGRISANYSPP